MNYQIRDLPLLKKILWADCLLGGSTALAGLFLYPVLSGFLGLRTNLLILIAAITLGYALLAFRLSLQRLPSVPLLRILVYANWAWTIISTVLLIQHYPGTTSFGAAFLILQVVVVGLLAYLEGRHIYRISP